jgi:hypothetical protein
LTAAASVRVYQSLRRTFLNLADYNLTVSSEFAHQLNENGITRPVHVWKTGVDSELFNPAYRSEAMRVRMFNGHHAHHKTLLVSVGRLSPEKHFDFLLKILERFPDAFLCVVGGGPYKDCLEPLFPASQAHFMGLLQGEELAAAYASADLFVYASVSETFGQVYLEAMSSGTPVVAAKGEQMKEFFVNGMHGYTWQPHDVDSACAAMRAALAQNRAVLSANCRATALQHSWHSSASQIEHVYVNLTEHCAAKPATLLTYLSHKLYGLGMLVKWVYLMLLVLAVMLPFMKVFKPQPQQQPPQLSRSSDEIGVPDCLATGNRVRRRPSRKSKSKSREGSKDRHQRDKNNNNTSGELSYSSRGSDGSFVERCVARLRHSFVSFSTHVTTLVISVMSITVMCAICLNINNLFMNSATE